VITAVLAQVALLAPVVDLGGDDGTVRDQLIELGLESIMGILGQPGHLGVRHLVVLLASVRRHPPQQLSVVPPGGSTACTADPSSRVYALRGTSGR
jgi:hypothetical protein